MSVWCGGFKGETGTLPIQGSARRSKASNISNKVVATEYRRRYNSCIRTYKTARAKLKGYSALSANEVRGLAHSVGCSMWVTEGKGPLGLALPGARILFPLYSSILGRHLLPVNPAKPSKKPPLGSVIYGALDR